MRLEEHYEDCTVLLLLSRFTRYSLAITSSCCDAISQHLVVLESLANFIEFSGQLLTRLSHRLHSQHSRFPQLQVDSLSIASWLIIQLV